MQACALDYQRRTGLFFLRRDKETPQEDIRALSGEHVPDGNPE